MGSDGRERPLCACLAQPASCKLLMPAATVSRLAAIEPWECNFN